MLLIRRLIGTIYIFGIIILALSVLYYIGSGIIPPVLKDPIQPGISFINSWADKISLPIAIIVDFILELLPFLRGLLPVTNTGILGAEIHWVPFFALFIYTGILKTIDDLFLRNKIKSIGNDYKKNQDDKQPPTGF